jgi:hypothetical protein
MFCSRPGRASAQLGPGRVKILRLAFQVTTASQQKKTPIFVFTSAPPATGQLLSRLITQPLAWLGQARERRDKCELSLRLGLRLFLVFLPFFIRQPLTFDDLALPTLVEFESKQKRSFEKTPVRIILNSFDI